MLAAPVFMWYGLSVVAKTGARKMEVTNNTDKYGGIEVLGIKKRTDRGEGPKAGSFETKGGQ